MGSELLSVISPKPVIRPATVFSGNTPALAGKGPLPFSGGSAENTRPVSGALARTYFGVGASQAVQPRFAGFYTPKNWKYGADYVNGVTRYKVWAPAASRVDIITIDPRKGPNDHRPLLDRIIDEETIPMESSDGNFYAKTPNHPPGTLYMFQLHYPDGKVEVKPDPRSFFQPEGVHGPSMVEDLKAFQPQAPENWWQNADFMQDDRRLIPYRLHIGAFSNDGTFEAAIQKLDHIADMGYNVVEIMPVMEIPGERGWSYDQVKHFATHRNYGRWQNLQRLVDEIHKRNMAASLDVCYNHNNIIGNYFGWFDPDFSNRPTDWGPGFNWENAQARKFVFDNLKQWVADGRFDMFRFDMTPHFHDDRMLRDINIKLSELSEDLGRPVFSVAEDYREWDELVKNLGFDKVYNFKGHHGLEAVLTGKHYMGEFPDVRNLFWLYALKNAPFSLAKNCNFGLSHDEIANGASETDKELKGKRPITKYEAMELSHPFERAMLKSLVKYFLPGMPRNFMGEEYGERADFKFYADYSDEFIQEKTRNNRQDPYDPFDPQAMLDSKLTWVENDRIKGLTKKAIELRKTVPALWQGDQKQFYAYEQDLESGVMSFKRWGDPKGKPDDEVLVVFNFSDNAFKPEDGKVKFPAGGKDHQQHNVQWEEIYNTDSPLYPGGEGRTNPGRFDAGKVGINLAPWSISVFRKTVRKPE